MPNGKRPTNTGMPQMKPPNTMEPADLGTMSLRVGSVNLVVMSINAPGKAISLLLDPDDCITWGERLSQAGRNAKSGLIV